MSEKKRQFLYFASQYLKHKLKKHLLINTGVQMG
jgi:hypothetical protein